MSEMFFLTISPAQTLTHPKREFRGAWIATVANLDWPTQSAAPSVQQAQLISIFDNLKAIGINAVIFQVRPECDALYQSSIEPWSYWLTGAQGVAPNPLWDPLEFAVKEAHKRGMELHAWFNPFRAVKTVKNGAPSYQLAPNHVAVKHPEWLLKFSNEWLLDPGLPEVRAYVDSVIMDVVRRYDVDGVSWDDYFYSYNGMTTQDSMSWRLYRGNFTNIADWRRNNINILVKAVHDSILAVKPWVKWGITPFGIWKSGTPAGISGLSAYDELYCDAVTWLAHGWVDYIGPELYWPFGGGQDYGKLAPWWSSVKNGRHLYVGQAPYRITDSNWGPSELPNQIRLNRTGIAEGEIFFRATYGVNNNPKGFADSLRTSFYKYPTLLPVMGWKDSIPPNPVQNLQYASASVDGAHFYWEVPTAASDGNTASRYVVYRFNHAGAGPQDIDSAQNISSTVDTNSVAPPIPPGSGPYYYTVTSLDRNWNESQMSTVVQVNAPHSPVLASPVNNFQDARDTISLRWSPSALAASYSIQVSSDSGFSSGLVVNATGISADSLLVSGMAGMQKYFWKVSASNAGGTGAFSENSSFTTAFPIAPLLAGPDSVMTDVDLLPQFAWRTTDHTTKYRLQVTKGAVFTSPAVDTTISDTLFTPSDSLIGNSIYSWRVCSGNEYGFSLWSNAWKFRTLTPTWIASREESATRFDLMQNYPNPFNPTTTIQFKVPSSGFVSLKVYDILGREVRTLVNETKMAGNYAVSFNASELPSGVYFYRLSAGTYNAVKKMVVVK